MTDTGRLLCCLLVDDHAAVRELAAEFLREYPLTVLEAHDGPSALEISRRHEGPIDILVSDVVMPGMSGIQLAAEIRSERRETAVLFTTGYSAELARTGTRDAVLIKPFSGDELRAAVRALLARRSG